MSGWRDRAEIARRHIAEALKETDGVPSSAWIPYSVAHKHIQMAEAEILQARAALEKTKAVQATSESGIGIQVKPIRLPRKRRSGL